MAQSNVVDLQAERVALQNEAWSESVRLQSLAQSSGRLKDMAAAVAAFDRFMRLAGMNEKQRREVWS